ncbi:dihydrodipicolinate synthase family protein [Rubrobacter xylanophilus]|uniref:Dihydrodipicolinate synthase family protein n=1 Tax=Rubrobacter xylanophilus TaxID=49319 RepID=A0A510HII0_9ACTN|nr:dihydrodipicolinate synthase family protein [Rubrobacter xylanophilus]BBL79790.1 dihydrodipicolinate synthase family protein [Rubrobacter xylanophilus]
MSEDHGGIRGIYVASVTPFREDASLTLDVRAYVEHVVWLSESGVRGIVAFGTNGEGPSVSLREKMEVLEELFARGLPVDVVPTVAQGNLPETLEILRFLEEYPARAIMVLPPYYFKPVSPEGLASFYERVMGATRHPVILYHVPKYAVPVPPELVERLPVWGVKDSGGEPGYAEAVLASGKGVLAGTEDDLWRRITGGSSGVVSALANFVPELIVETYEAARSGDEHRGRALSERLKEVRAMTKEHDSRAALKRLAEARHGVPLGTVRPPLVPAPDGYDPDRVLRAVMKTWGKED